MGSPLPASNWHLCCSSTTLNDGFIYFFFIAVISLPDYNLELRSSSLTLGNVSELSFLSLNRDLFAIVDIDAFGAGLAAEADAVEGVPCLAVERDFARRGVKGADGGSLAAAADEAHGDALGQVVGGSG